jgi:tRNA (guanine-N7-)-methyltransferase
MKMNPTKKNTIRSYVKREGRLTASQEVALDSFWVKHGIDFSHDEINMDELYKRRAPLVLDIGVGTGNATYTHALAHPENNYLAIEVHRPGVGQLLNKIESSYLTNIKISNDDAINVLQEQIPDDSISQVFIFFPDPWPKNRHHKRRLINKPLIELIKKKITMHGRLHIATDWQAYAKHIQGLCDTDPVLINLSVDKVHSCPRPEWRISTRYESRGLRLEHKVWEFCYGFSRNTQNTRS